MIINGNLLNVYVSPTPIDIKDCTSSRMSGTVVYRIFSFKTEFEILCGNIGFVVGIVS